MATLSLEVSAAVAADFNALTEEERRAIALAVAAQVGQMRKTSETEAGFKAAYDQITSQMSDRAARAGLTQEALDRIVDESR